MPLFLKKREMHLKELMDAPGCDQQLLFNTYKQFSRINKNFSRWDRIFNLFFLQQMFNRDITYTILDIGCGGGDVAVQLADWAHKNNIKVEILGIDPDPRAFEFRKQNIYPHNIKFRSCHAQDLLSENKKFDFVISNHLLHHLSSVELSHLFNIAPSLCNKMVIFNDLCRNDFSYLFFKIFSFIFYRNSFSQYDGCLSIRRSYTGKELKSTIPSKWHVHTLFPARLLVVMPNRE